MKLVSLETGIVLLPNDEPLAGFSENPNAKNPIVWLKLRTDNGIEGLGVTYFGGALTRTLRHAVDELGALVIGEDPLRVEAVAAKLRAAAVSAGPAGIFLMAMSAIDVALWDIKGKALGLPAEDVDRLARLSENGRADTVEEEMRRLPGFEKALAAYDDRGRTRYWTAHTGHDAGVTHRCYLALVLWHLGYPDQALRVDREMRELARTIGHAFSLEHAIDFAAYLAHYCRLGAEVQVPVLNGTAELRIPPGSQPNQILKLKGKGLPRLRQRGHGDHGYRLILEVPQKLNAKQREALLAYEAASRGEHGPLAQAFLERMKKLFG